MQELLDAGLLHGDCLTVTGKTIAENLADLDPPDARRRRRAPARRRRSTRRAASRSSRGSLAPKGAVVKVAGIDRDALRGPGPRVRRRGPRRWRRSSPGKIKPGDVVVIRYEGPKGGPGHARDARGHRRDEGRRPRRRRRARHRRSLLGRHARLLRRPRRARGRRRRPDRVRRRRRPHRDRRRRAHDRPRSSTTPSSTRRKANWKLPEPRYTSGFLAKYAELAQGAETGAITNF